MAKSRHRNKPSILKKKHPALRAKSEESMINAIPNKKGIFSEYLNRNLNFEQLKQERKKQLKRISDLREGREIFVYAADLNKNGAGPIHIDHQDLTPINDQISILDGDRLDLILQTPGGIGEVAEDIVKLLRSKFNEVNIIVPKIAKSAGTLIAMAGNDILMEPISALGPIDAQIVAQGKQFSADAFIAGLNEIKDEVDTSGRLNSAYIPILQAISPGEIQNAKNALKFATELVTEWLTKYKFKNWTHRRRDNEPITDKMRRNRAAQIADELSKHSKWLTHGRSLKIEDLRAMELDITDYSENADLADAIRRYQILLELTFLIGGVIKMYETLNSEITIQLNAPAQSMSPMPPMLQQIMPQNLATLDADVDCANCGTSNPIQINFDNPQPIKPNFVAFPSNNVIKCRNCQAELNLAALRNQIEQQFRKKIV